MMNTSFHDLLGLAALGSLFYGALIVIWLAWVFRPRRRLPPYRPDEFDNDHA